MSQDATPFTTPRYWGAAIFFKAHIFKLCLVSSDCIEITGFALQPIKLLEARFCVYSAFDDIKYIKICN